MTIRPPSDLLIHRDDLEDPGAVSMVMGDGGSRLDILIVRRGDEIWAYENSCPHQGTPLETFDARFFTTDKKRLLCSTHGAEFRIEDGRCLKGPCKDLALRVLPVFVDDSGAVRLQQKK